jgi:MFS superfamily sulfate permease-like transporter
VVIDYNTLFIIVINDFLNGIFVGLGFCISILIIFRQIKKEIPHWINEFRKEMQKINAIQRVDDVRRRYR